jgi:hypothetical protein
MIQAGIMGWFKLITELAHRAERKFGSLGPFTAEEVAALISNAFIGGEGLYLLGLEKKGVPVRQALRRFGELIRIAESTYRNRGLPCGPNFHSKRELSSETA